MQWDCQENNSEKIRFYYRLYSKPCHEEALTTGLEDAREALEIYREDQESNNESNTNEPQTTDNFASHQRPSSRRLVPVPSSPPSKTSSSSRLKLLRAIVAPAKSKRTKAQKKQQQQELEEWQQWQQQQLQRQQQQKQQQDNKMKFYVVSPKAQNMSNLPPLCQFSPRAA